jgi:protein-tyrosine phosphatase
MSLQRVLFVCSGNVFRSLAAEYCTKKFLPPNAQIEVSSAGTVANAEPVPGVVLDELALLGIDARSHRQRKLEARLLDGIDVVIAMGRDHRDHLRAMGVDARLFHQWCKGVDEPVLDAHEAFPGGPETRAAREQYIRRAIREIHQAAPALILALEGDAR